MVETGEKKRLDLPDNIKHIYAPSIEFCHGWANNIGLRSSSRPIIIFGEADVFMNLDNLYDAYQKAISCEVVLPWKRFIRLDQTQSEMLMDQSTFHIKKEEFDAHTWAFPSEEDLVIDNTINDGSGMVIMQKEAAFKVGGWEESVSLWGTVDTIQDIKIKALCNFEKLDYDLYHMYHPRSLSETPQHQKYADNLYLLQCIQEMSKDKLLKQIDRLTPNIGQLNKHQQKKHIIFFCPLAEKQKWENALNHEKQKGDPIIVYTDDLSWLSSSELRIIHKFVGQQASLNDPSIREIILQDLNRRFPYYKDFVLAN